MLSLQKKKKSILTHTESSTGRAIVVKESKMRTSSNSKVLNHNFC